MGTVLMIVVGAVVLGFIIYIATKKRVVIKKGGATGPTPRDTKEEV